jgi:hypothetical protein
MWATKAHMAAHHSVSGSKSGKLDFLRIHASVSPVRSCSIECHDENCWLGEVED